MNATDYIIQTLKYWKQKFPNIHLCYWFEQDTQYHIITVEQTTIYGDDEFIKCENTLYDEFYKKYDSIDILVAMPSHSLKPINEIYKS